MMSSLASTLEKGAEFGRRRLSLLAPDVSVLSPGRAAGDRAIEAVLVLQHGPNPSTDHYLRPRLPLGLPCHVIDLSDDPTSWTVLRSNHALLIVICRYVTPRWLDALERVSPERVAVFVDDDLPAMIRDVSLPGSVRGKVASLYGRHAQRLSALATDVWVSTPALAALHPHKGVVVLPPIPDADPCEPERGAPPRVAYHGSDVHGEERRFVVEVARILHARAPGVTVEITGDEALRRSAGGLPNLEVIAQAPWPAYRNAQAGRRAAVFLAPLTRSPLNDARAPVKAFDAARLGAAAVFADVPVYRDWVRPGVDGLLAEMTPAAFADASLALIEDEPRRLSLARAARERLVALRAAVGGLPGLAT